MRRIDGMDIKKETHLRYEYKDEKENVLARISVVITGDGTTPNVLTQGGEQFTIGYDDYGTPVYAKVDDAKLAELQRQFMAEAIKEQKRMTAENGLDPNMVNTNGGKQ